MGQLTNSPGVQEVESSVGLKQIFHLSPGILLFVF